MTYMAYVEYANAGFSFIIVVNSVCRCGIDIHNSQWGCDTSLTCEED